MPVTYSPHQLTVCPQAKAEAGPSGLPGMGGADAKMEDAGEDDDEDEDDEDMEEVS